MKRIVKRTFEALRHPEGSEERAKLNRDVATSQYNTSHRYLIEKTNFMSDGSINPAQPVLQLWTYRTRREAESAFDSI